MRGNCTHHYTHTDAPTVAPTVCRSVAELRGVGRILHPQPSQQPSRVAGPTRARTGRRMARCPEPLESQWTCERIGGAYFSRTASTHDREHANRSTDTANAPCKAVKVTVKGAETLRVYFHGSAEIDGPGAALGSCGDITMSPLPTPVFRRVNTDTLLASRRSFCAFLWHSLQRRARPSLVRPSARYEDVGYSTPQSAHVFTMAPFHMS